MKTLVKNNGNLFPAMPSLLNDLFTDDWFNSSLSNWKSSGATLPAVNVRETNDDFQIEVAAPGMKRDDFKVELDNNVLTVSSQREDRQEEKDAQGNYTRREFSYQAFQRSFSLPTEKVEGDNIVARYADGILHITVPKKENAKVRPAKQIAVA
ncbi:MAG TPA: Hsp20/alpha crystallin family protein [Ohtaekwangia sp.]|nr:Hsp20/alpha crystallin family protein [Ohtaekwangia sp.]